MNKQSWCSHIIGDSRYIFPINGYNLKVPDDWDKCPVKSCSKPRPEEKPKSLRQILIEHGNWQESYDEGWGAQVEKAAKAWFIKRIENIATGERWTQGSIDSIKRAIGYEK